MPPSIHQAWPNGVIAGSFGCHVGVSTGRADQAPPQALSRLHASPVPARTWPARKSADERQLAVARKG